MPHQCRPRARPEPYKVDGGEGDGERLQARSSEEGEVMSM